MAGPILWTPDDLDAGPALWLDASDGTSWTGTNWTDKSGNNRTFRQTTTNAKPVLTASAINGLSALRFDGSNDYLYAYTADVGTLYQDSPGGAVFCVASQSGGDTQRLMFWQAEHNTVNPIKARVGLLSSSTSTMVWTTRIDEGTQGGISRTAIAAPGLFGATFDFVNGPATVGVNGSYSTGTVGNSGGNTSNTTPTRTDIGGLAGASYRFAGDIGEILALQGVPTTATQQRIEGYLAWKWGLYASLPTSHPYRYVAPFVGHDFDALALRLALAAFVGQIEIPPLSHAFAALPLRLALAGFATNYVPSAPPDLSDRSGTVATLYRASIGGVFLPLAGMQCRRRLGASTWLTIEVPGWTASLQTWLESSIGASLIVEMGTGATDFGLWLNAVVTAVDAERAPFGSGFTVTARVQNPSYTAGARTLRGVSQRMVDGSRHGAVCAVDGLLKPNDTVDDGLASWTVGTAEYRIDASGARMTVWEDA